MNFLSRIRRELPGPVRRGLADLHPDLQYIQIVYSSDPRFDAAIVDLVGAARAYEEYVWVHKAVSMACETLASLPVRVVTADGKPAPAHPVSELLAAGNDADDPGLLWALYFMYKLLAGDVPVEVVSGATARRVPVEWWVRRPDQTTIIPDAARAAYPRAAAYQFGQNDPIPSDAVVFDRFPNPISSLRGLAPIAAASRSIRLDWAALDQGIAMFRNGARPDYAIETTQVLSPDERKRLDEQIADKFGGIANAGKPMLLEYGQSITPISWAPKDVEWLAQREASRQEIGAIFNTPDEIMGFGKDTYENFDAAYKVYWTLGLLPLAQRRDAAWTGWAARRGLLRPGERVASDLTGIAVLQEALGPKLEHAAALWTMGVPFNTVDRTLRLGIGAIPGGDVGWVSSSVVPIDQAMAPPAPPAAAPPPAEPPPEPPAQRAIRLASIRVKAASHPGRRMGQALRRVRTEVAGRMAPAIDQWFQDLADQVVERARREAEKSLAAHTNGNGPAVAVKSLPKLDRLLFPRDGDSLRDLFQTYILDLIRLSWEVWNGALGVEIGFERTDPAVVAALAQAGDQIRGIMETTREAVRSLLQYGAEQGWSIDDLVVGDDSRPGLLDLVAQTYQGRARAIARTELGTAQNVTTVARYAASDVREVIVLDNGVEDSDADCRELDGTVKPLSWAKDNALGHPNCLRAFAPYLD